MFPYEDRLPNPCSFTDSNSKKNALKYSENFGNGRENYRESRKWLENSEGMFFIQSPPKYFFGKFSGEF